MNTRDAYIEKTKAKLDAANARLDQLEAKAPVAKADAKAKYEEKLGAARHRRDEAKQKLGDLRTASESAWEGLKRGCEDSWGRFRDAVEQAARHFRD